MIAKKMFHIIVSECENGCTDFTKTLQYFDRYYNGEYSFADLVSLVAPLDFEHLRKNRSALFALTVEMK
jgi:hypothetical protein